MKHCGIEGNVGTRSVPTTMLCAESQCTNPRRGCPRQADDLRDKRGEAESAAPLGQWHEFAERTRTALPSESRGFSSRWHRRPARRCRRFCTSPALVCRSAPRYGIRTRSPLLIPMANGSQQAVTGGTREFGGCRKSPDHTSSAVAQELARFVGPLGVYSSTAVDYSYSFFMAEI